MRFYLRLREDGASVKSVRRSIVLDVYPAYVNLFPSRMLRLTVEEL